MKYVCLICAEKVIEQMPESDAAKHYRSIAILEKIGLKFERMLKLPGENEEISLYAILFGDTVAP